MISNKIFTTKEKSLEETGRNFATKTAIPVIPPNKKCGYYECKKCGNRFLSLQTMEKIPCPDCEAEIDYEIGPDESMEDILDTAQLLQKIEGEEEVEKMDALLSLAITGGDCNWI